MKREEYLQILTDQIRCRMARDAVKEEYCAHIEDQMQDFMSEGMDRKEAEKAAVKEMGDPVETGNELDRIHRPVMPWGMIALVAALSIIGFVIQMTMQGKVETAGGYGWMSISRNLFFMIIGLAVMMELARMLETNSILLRRSVILVAFGASTMSYSGAWYFLNRTFAEDVGRIDAMINLDMLGTADNGLYAYTASNADLNALITALGRELQPVLPSIVAEEPYPSDHRAFYSMEIPSVMLTSGKYPEHNTDRDTGSIIDYGMMEKALEYAYNLTVSVANTDKPLSFRPVEIVPRDPSYDDVVAFNDCDVRPMFLNSHDPAQFLQRWVYQYLRYPQSAVEEGVQGRVVVDFIIEKDGRITGARVIRSVDPRLDEEALRVVNASPKWRPGRVNGQKVRTSMTIPIEFVLERKSERNRFGIKR